LEPPLASTSNVIWLRVSPGYLLRHSRYAVLAIIVVTAVITPTADPLNLMLFAAPLILLFFSGIMCSSFFLLPSARRWKYGLIGAAGTAALVSGGCWFARRRPSK